MAEKKISILLILFFNIVFCGILTSQNIVVSSYRNDAISGGDPRDEWTELLVIDDNIDLRNYSLRDNNGSQTAWQPAITFNNIAFWNHLRAGTIIIVWHRAVGSNSVTHPLDINKSDGYIEVHANDPTYFSGGNFGTSPSYLGPTLNISNSGDIIQIRNASLIHVHALGHKAVIDSCFTNLPLPKLNHQQNLASQKAGAVYVCPGTNLQEYGWNSPQNGTTYTDTSSLQVSKGLPNQCSASSTANSDYWRSLRQPLWTTPAMLGSFTAPSTIGLDWTSAIDPNPADGTQGYIVLRNLVNTFTSPADGHTYSVGESIGSSTVIAVILSSQTLSYNDSYSLACGQTVYYRVYAFRYATDENNGNDYNLARGRAYNETNYAAASVSRAAGPVITLVQPVNPSCNSNNGSITIFANGTGTLQYSIDNGTTWQTSFTFSNLSAGSYNIVVKDPSGCQTNYAGNPVVLTSSPAAAIISVTPTNATCGNNDGVISISATGGTPPLSYSINNGTTWQSGFVFNNLAPGNYYVVVEDDNGCQTVYASNPVVISNSGGASIISVTPADATCNNNNGSITITANGGTPPLSYSINNGTTWQSGFVFNNLAPGNYYVVVEDDNGCQTVYASNPVVISSSSGASIISVTPVNATCNNSNGSITIAASGGTPPLTYSIDNGATWSSGSIFGGLAPGNYYIAVQDDNGCVTFYGTNPVTISSAGGAIINSVLTTPETCGAGNGSITIDANSGTPPLQYSIDDGATWKATSLFNGLSQGDYNVIVLDANNCLTPYPFNPVSVGITGGPEINNVATEAATCGFSNGTLTISAINGTPPLEYSIDNGITYLPGNNINGLAPGNYYVVVKDANNCSSPYPANPVSIFDQASPLILSVDTIPSSCGYNNGSIIISADGGTEPILYSIDNGISWIADSAGYNNLAAGTYNVVIKDDIGCVTLWTSNPVAVNNTSGATIDSVHATDAGCGSDGAIQIYSSGGTDPVLYSIDNGTTWNASSSFSGLAPGNYTVLTTDLNNCQTAFITNPVEIKSASGAYISGYSVADETCSLSNGELTVTTTGSPLPISYSIDNGLTWQDSAHFTGLPAASYWLVTMGLTNCLTPYPFNPVDLINHPGPVVDTTLSKDATCNQDNGSVEIFTSGGTMPLVFSTDNGITWQDSAIFRNLAAGSYHIAAKDTNQCISYYNYNPLPINSIPVAEIQLSQTGSVCYGQEWNLTPGTGFLSYVWQDGSSQATFKATDEGLYWVIVTDTNGCIQNDSVSIVKCSGLFGVPSAFSPDLDGKNEVFRVIAFHPEKIVEFRMHIYNRWGQLVFETNSLLGYWDGRLGGHPCDAGVYSYLIEFRAEDGYLSGQKSPLRGMVTIIK